MKTTSDSRIEQVNEAKQSLLGDPVEFFSQAISNLSGHHSTFIPKNFRAQLLNLQSHCPLCSKDLPANSATVVTQIIPIDHGGTTELANCFLACNSCSKERGTSDLLTWPAPPQAPESLEPGQVLSRAHEFSFAGLLARRQELLSRSANHWTPHTPNSSKQAICNHLAKRWTEPRFRVFAHRSSDLALVGFASRSGDSQSVGVARVLTRFVGSGAVLSSDRSTVYRVGPERFLDLVWALIELNALVVPVEIEGIEDFELSDNWQDFWTDHVLSVGQLRTRLRPGNAMDRGRIARCPAAPRVYSEKPKAMRARQRNAANVEHNRRQRLNRWHQECIQEAEQNGDAFAVLRARLASL